MEHKRITIFAGHYGSGKTNLAVNFALYLRKFHERVAIADLDIVNPYFRTKDSEAVLQASNIRMITSDFANTNVDVPAMPASANAVFDDRELFSVLDVGGDDRGALALGRYAPMIRPEDAEMLLVVNCYRPMSRDAASVAQIREEIERASHVPFTAIVNNSNLGKETAVEDVLDSLGYAEEIARLTGLPLKFTSVRADLYPVLKDRLTELFPLNLTTKKQWRL